MEEAMLRFCRENRMGSYGFLGEFVEQVLDRARSPSPSLALANETAPARNAIASPRSAVVSRRGSAQDVQRLSEGRMNRSRAAAEDEVMGNAIREKSKIEGVIVSSPAYRR